jgi:hypothetical protein
MSSFCTIHEHNVSTGKEIIKTYTWHIFSMNMREMASSLPKHYKQPHHAKDAAERFVNCFRNVNFRPGIVRKRK